MDDCDTLREELATKYPKHGHALREPDPGGLYTRVEVGDVGVIREGCFCPLFNALNPPSDPNSHHGPKYPAPLQPKRSPHIRSSTDNQQYFCSDNVTKVSCDPNPFTSGPDDRDEAPVTFSYSGRGKGALLYLPLLAERHDTVARGDFGEWMLENIDTCFRVAEDLGYGVERMEDIILVTGYHLAKSWVSVAFSESRGGSQVSFGVRVSGSSGVHFDERNVNGRGLKFGPGGENLPQNQCIFVRGFRVTRILNIWPRLRGAGPAPDFGEHEPEPDRRLELISIPADTDYQDPLHFLSAHIAEQAPDCDMILVHDDDLQFISDVPDGPKLIRDTQCYGSAIRQVQCNKPGSGSEAAINTVATLSKDVFEEQQEDRHNPEYSRPMAIISVSAHATSRPKSPEIPGPASSDIFKSSFKLQSSVKAFLEWIAISTRLDALQKLKRDESMRNLLSHLDSFENHIAHCSRFNGTASRFLPGDTFSEWKSFGTAPELEPYSSGLFFSRIDPSLAFKLIEIYDRNSPRRCYSRIGSPLSYSFQAGTWHIMLHASAVLPLSLRVQNSLLALDFSARATQGMVVPQRRWETPFGWRPCRADCLERHFLFVHRNNGVGFWLPEILQDHNHNPCERDDETPPKRRTHICINVEQENLGNDHFDRSSEDAEPGPTQAAFSSSSTHRATDLGQAAAENLRISDIIDEQLDIDRRSYDKSKHNQRVRLLVLCQAESAKSTVLKNFQLTYSADTLDQGRSSWRTVIHLNLARSVKHILEILREDWRWMDPEHAVLSICSSLLAIVDIDGAYAVRFAHFSVKEHLTSNRLAESKDTISRFHVSMTLTHTIIAQACLGVLLHIDENITEDDLKKFPLAEYAAEQWTAHARVEGGSPNIQDGMKRLFDPSNCHFSVCLWIYHLEWPTGIPGRSRRPSQTKETALHHAAFHGLNEVAKFLIVERFRNVNSQDLQLDETPLSVASRRGYSGIARALLEHGADTGTGDNDNHSSLDRASQKGHVEVVWGPLESLNCNRHQVQFSHSKNWARSDECHGINTPSPPQET